jgi:glycerol-3-phosphate dehydrogenase
LPFDGRVLVGTTDLPYAGRPEEAVASEDELAYLLRGVNRVFPSVELSPSDIEMHYSGVRPLPRTDDKSTASVTRRHWMQQHAGAEVPAYSIVGGKLTTCRSLAESAADTIMTRLGVRRVANSRDRVVPGGEDYPSDASALAARQRSIAEASGFSLTQVEAVWQLSGTTTREWLCPAGDSTVDDKGSVADTDIPRAFVRRVIEKQWVARLDDLVERRLMLLFDPLSLATLEDLATLLVESGRLRPDQAAPQITATVQRLRTHFGKSVSTD